MEEKNEILKELIEHQYKVNLETRQTLKTALDEINKTNQEIKIAIQLQTAAIANVERFWGKIVFILVIAISLLAGAEKIINLFGIA